MARLTDGRFGRRLTAERRQVRDAGKRAAAILLTQARKKTEADASASTTKKSGRVRAALKR